ncbi:MAG: nucleotidyltransferase domain-containing protein [Deltaproteobacteria bacterium]|nr:nucleotidyltransferase domain-containing protein [Deltaproteobacteria bacterium]
MTATSLQRKLKEICRRYHVDIMYAYGSRCHEIKDYIDGRGLLYRASPSDVDIGVRVSEGHHLPVRDKVNLTIELEDLFDVGRVDLVVLAGADPFLAANIIRGERLYAGDEYAADEYELYILRRAGDLAYLERERLALIFREPLGGDL